MLPQIKTILEQNSMSFREIRHNSLSTTIASPVDFAHALGYDLNRITKSVFLRSKSKDAYAMAVCSAGRKLDFRKIATLLGYDKIEVADKHELSSIVGYPPTGVCSIGLPTTIPVIVDEAILLHPTVFIGSGEVGIEIEINPSDLVKASNAIVADIVLPQSA